MPDKLRFGILGCGVIGKEHVRAVAALPEDAALAAVADTVPERARELGEQAGVRYHDDLAELIARPDVDAVAVCTPSGLHAEHAVAALRAGKHVVVEKPVDITLPAIDELLRVQRATPLKAAVISQHRWDPASQLVHEAVAAGRFGKLTLAAAQVRWWRSQGYYDSGEWRGTWALDGGGALMNQSIHTVDLLHWMMGDVVEIAAYTGLQAHERIEVEDAAVAVLRFANGALGVIEGTTAAYPGLTARLEVHGDRGSAVIDSDELAYFHAADPEQEGAAYGASGGGNQAEELLRSRGDVAGSGPTAGSDPAALSGVSHREQYRDFIAAVREYREPLLNVEEARKVVAIILAVYESARAGGRPVKVQQAAITS